MVYQDNRIITLNSNDGEKLNGTYLSNINFNFSGLLKDEKNLIRSYITVLNAQIPVSFYIIDETNNILNYTENLVDKIVELVPGNYNGNQMIAALNGVFETNGTPITTQLNSITGLLYFFITGGVEITILATSTIKSILGFEEDITSTTFIKMPYQLNLLGKKKIFINSNNLRNSAFSSKSLSCVQTIATIPVDQPPYNMISYVSVSDLEKIILSNRALDLIDIEIVDENNNYVNFRNINWSITLCLSVEKNDVEKLDYGLFNLPSSILEENKNSIENNKKLSRDEKELRLLES
jgi:hypothetical protein